jgi:hypothetical protein
MALTDTLDVGHPASEQGHDYQCPELPAWEGTSSFFYEGEQDDLAVVDDGRAFSNACSFQVRIDAANDGVCLRRRLDQGRGPTRALVSVDGEAAGTWYLAGTNSFKRWLDSDFLIPASLSGGKSNLTIRIESQSPEWSEYRYWVYSLKAVDAPAALTDADTDGLPDEWELWWFDGIEGGAGSTDADGDGATNWQEYVAGTAPTSAPSRLSLDAVSGTNTVSIRFDEVPAEGPGYAGMERRYTLRSAPSLAATGAWAALPGMDGMAATASVTAVTEVTGDGPAFYRLDATLQPQTLAQPGD